MTDQAEIRPRPKDDILQLKDRLMKEVFDHEGNYIPKDLRRHQDPQIII